MAYNTILSKKIWASFYMFWFFKETFFTWNTKSLVNGFSKRKILKLKSQWISRGPATPHLTPKYLPKYWFFWHRFLSLETIWWVHFTQQPRIEWLSKNQKIIWSTTFENYFYNKFWWSEKIYYKKYGYISEIRWYTHIFYNNSLILLIV